MFLFSGIISLLVAFALFFFGIKSQQLGTDTAKLFGTFLYFLGALNVIAFIILTILELRLSSYIYY